MSDNQSALDVLQDPLLTLLALVIFGTLPVIIPGTFSPPDRISFEDIKAELIQHEEVLNKSEEELQGLRLEQHMALSKASQREKDEAEERAVVEREIQSLQIRIDELRKRYQLRQRYREELKHELEERRIEAEKRRSSMNYNWKALEAIENKIAEERWRLDNLDKRIEQLSEKDRQGGISAYETVRPKTVVYFEADGKRIYRIDENNYDFRIERSFSVWTQNYRLVRKAFAGSCSIDELYQAGCDFEPSLSYMRSRKAAVIFMVREDSYDIFLEARVIAEDLGFAVGWKPLPRTAVITSSAGSSSNLPELSVRRRGAYARP